MVLVLLFVALAVRGRAMLSMNESLHLDPDGYGMIASRMAHDWKFARLAPDGGAELTAYRPPLYPMLLSVCYVMPEFTSGFGLLHVLLGVGTVWGVVRLGELSGLDRARRWPPR